MSRVNRCPCPCQNIMMNLKPHGLIHVRRLMSQCLFLLWRLDTAWSSLVTGVKLQPGFPSFLVWQSLKLRLPMPSLLECAWHSWCQYGLSWYRTYAWSWTDHHNSCSLPFAGPNHRACDHIKGMLATPYNARWWWNCTGTQPRERSHDLPWFCQWNWADCHLVATMCWTCCGQNWLWHWSVLYAWKPLGTPGMGICCSPARSWEPTCLFQVSLILNDCGLCATSTSPPMTDCACRRGSSNFLGWWRNLISSAWHGQASSVRMSVRALGLRLLCLIRWLPLHESPTKISRVKDKQKTSEKHC